MLHFIGYTWIHRNIVKPIAPNFVRAMRTTDIKDSIKIQHLNFPQQPRESIKLLGWIPLFSKQLFLNYIQPRYS